VPRTIDADTHIDETEDTWEYMLPSEQEFKPVVGTPSNPDPNRPIPRYWMIDGERQPRLARNDERTKTKVEARELLDVNVRIRDMDSLDVQTHVIYPTMFIIQPTERPDIDLAIKRSYNRWLGDRCAQSGGRLRWVCLPPLMTMDETLEELRWAKDHGAVGVYKKGNDEAGRAVSDPYFEPFWKEANDLDLAVCFHTGSGIPNMREARAGRARVPSAFLPQTFSEVVNNRLPQRFPNVRWGFIEAASGWVPHELYKIERRLKRLPEAGMLKRDDLPADFDLQRNLVREFNLFVTCHVDEDLPYILQFMGDDNLIVGSDYTHADASMERNFQDELRGRVAKGEITTAVVDRMLYDNPKRLYGL
jgi:predicted TIM-barrel fold metal-dependent hydrolase